MRSCEIAASAAELMKADRAAVASVEAVQREFSMQREFSVDTCVRGAGGVQP